MLVQASNETQNKTIVPTASHIPLYMSTILEVLSNVLAPALISQWFLTDIVRRTTEVARSIFDYCLSPACSTTAAKRVRSLSRIVASTSLLISLSSAFQAPLRNLLYRALIHRVHDGPKVQYEILDKTLERAFTDIYGSSRPGQVTHAVLEVVRIESWGEPGIHLRVGPFHYIRLAVINATIVINIFFPFMLRANDESRYASNDEGSSQGKRTFPGSEQFDGEHRQAALFSGTLRGRRHAKRRIG